MDAAHFAAPPHFARSAFTGLTRRQPRRAEARSENNRRARHYTITAAGRKHLGADGAEFERLLAANRAPDGSRLTLFPPGGRYDPITSRLIVACLALSTSVLAQPGVKGRKLTAEDYYRIKTVGSPQLSPNGAWVAFTVSTRFEEDNTTGRNLRGQRPPDAERAEVVRCVSEEELSQ